MLGRGHGSGHGRRRLCRVRLCRLRRHRRARCRRDHLLCRRVRPIRDIRPSPHLLLLLLLRRRRRRQARRQRRRRPASLCTDGPGPGSDAARRQIAHVWKRLGVRLLREASGGDGLVCVEVCRRLPGVPWRRGGGRMEACEGGGGRASPAEAAPAAVTAAVAAGHLLDHLLNHGHLLDNDTLHLHLHLLDHLLLDLDHARVVLHRLDRGGLVRRRRRKRHLLLVLGLGAQLLHRLRVQAPRLGKLRRSLARRLLQLLLRRLPLGPARLGDGLLNGKLRLGLLALRRPAHCLGHRHGLRLLRLPLGLLQPPRRSDRSVVQIAQTHRLRLPFGLGELLEVGRGGGREHALLLRARLRQCRRARLLRRPLHRSISDSKTSSTRSCAAARSAPIALFSLTSELTRASSRCWSIRLLRISSSGMRFSSSRSTAFSAASRPAALFCESTLFAVDG